MLITIMSGSDLFGWLTCLDRSSEDQADLERPALRLR